MEGRAWSSVQNPVVGLLALFSLISYASAAACLARPNCGQLCTAQLWPVLYGPTVASFVWPNRGQLAWPKCGQLSMAQPSPALYSPTVASFV